ncbi:MAG TPA: hypothetical protein VFU86_23200 [Terriglobales bacterium]|nr:hypothetical protein [Terriglobales bacterium]
MTVISTLICDVCTVHASDSFITQRMVNGDLVPIESEESKIIRVNAWKGALSYWGLATCSDYGWNTAEWLRNQASAAQTFCSAEAFASHLTVALNSKLATMRFRNPLEKGIGIHLTAYERLHDCEIPELFLISNWASPSYDSLRDLSVSRETFHTVTGEAPMDLHREFQYRKQVYDCIHARKLLVYNNGHPSLFNKAANGLFGLFYELYQKNTLLNTNDFETWLRVTRRPIEAIIQAQRDFVPQSERRVGGQPHALSIAPTGECWSFEGTNSIRRL